MTRGEPSRLARSIAGALLALTVALLVVTVAQSSWVIDDAYISLRTVDNFLHGHGLRYNPAERVQAYTHPLWLGLLTAGYALTREPFYTLLALGWLTTAATVLVVLSAFVRQPLAAPSALLATGIWLWLLLGARAFVDYSTSGLENSLAHLLFALFYVELARGERRTWGACPPSFDANQARRVVLWAALAFVNRQDSLPAYLPGLALLGWHLLRGTRARAPTEGARSPHARRILGAVALGAAPALLWELFSLVYYGSLIPNTAYAKRLSGISFTFALRQGQRYFEASLEHDPLLVAVPALALLAAGFAPRTRRAPMAGALGALASATYVLGFGAAGTHMAGRFLTLAFFAASLTLLDVLSTLDARVLSPLLGLSVAFGTFRSDAPLHTRGCDWIAQPYSLRWQRGVVDVRRAVCMEGGALALAPRGVLPAHPWYQAGALARAQAGQGPLIYVPAEHGHLAVGYLGFAAGPKVHLVDTLGLTDPLLARLPPDQHQEHVAGHFARAIPAGYLDSLAEDDNRIVSPGIHALYADVRLLTRAPLWSAERARAIWRLTVR